MEYLGIIWHNEIFADHFPIKGLDVSHHQGKIDWEKVAALKKYQFVFIKATEGHDFIDDEFLSNWYGAKKHGFKVGAYQFFSMRSTGAEQAKYFIATVPLEEGSLPPVIDVEIPLTNDPALVKKELKSLAVELEKYYHQKPIFYLTYETNSAYIGADFRDYDVWIRDISVPPFRLNRSWLFWQYSNRGRIDGIQEYTDINVFNGTEEQFNRKFN